MKGVLPPEVFEFIPGMAVFNVATNELTGPIPTEL